jgi:hypothetical protein
MPETANTDPRLLSEEQIDQLKRLATQSDVLMDVARAHAALILASHVVKWLSAILGTLVLLKGFLPW